MGEVGRGLRRPFQPGKIDKFLARFIGLEVGAGRGGLSALAHEGASVGEVVMKAPGSSPTSQRPVVPSERERWQLLPCLPRPQLLQRVTELLLRRQL